MLEGVPGWHVEAMGNPQGRAEIQRKLSLWVGFQHKSPAFCLFTPLEGGKFLYVVSTC